MVHQEEFILESLKNIQSLTRLPKSDMYISDPQEGEVVTSIKVYNDAPVSTEGGKVVFYGVGLHIIDGRKENSHIGNGDWNKRISKVRTSDNIKIPKQGYWFGKGQGGNPWPQLTSDQGFIGEVLFPGETGEYEIKIKEIDLPYLDIKLEGSVSRRHLLHTSRTMHELKKWS